MKTFCALVLSLIVEFSAWGAGLPPERAEQVRELLHQYGRDDQRLAGARHYARTNEGKDGTIREEAWALETGELLKVARERQGATEVVREEYSFNADGDVYFAFHRVDEKQPEGGTKITEHRTYVENTNTIAMRRRIVNLPAGAPLELSPKLTSQELNVEALPEAEQKMSTRIAEEAKGITDRVRDPKWLDRDPAKEAGPEWARVKAVKGTLSPDGRYAVAIAPTKKKFDWADYQDKELGDDVYTVDADGGDGVDNVIVDFHTHRIVGKTLGKYFGTKASYNHRTCSVSWSPDSHLFAELTDDKWYTETASIGRLEDGKLVGVVDLLKAATKRGAEFLVASKNKEYRQHAKEMEVAVFEPDLHNDGTGSLRVIFQVPKSIDISMVVRFRFVAGKLEMLDAKLGE